MAIEKTVELKEDLVADEGDSSVTYAHLFGSIDSMGASDISYNIAYNQKETFVKQTKNFRTALRNFQDRVWDEADEFMTQLEEGAGDANDETPSEE